MKEYRENILVKNLEVIRQSRRQTVPEFARSIGIPRSTLNDLLSTGNATMDTLMRISEGLDISLYKLFYDDQLDDRAMEECDIAPGVMRQLKLLAKLTPEGQRKIAFHIEEVLRDEARNTVTSAS